MQSFDEYKGIRPYASEIFSGIYQPLLGWKSRLLTLSGTRRPGRRSRSASLHAFLRRPARPFGCRSSSIRTIGSPGSKAA